jgi:DNA-binding transcriptional MerR regulator
MAEVKKLLEDSDFHTVGAMKHLRKMLNAKHAEVQAELAKGVEKARIVLAEIERNRDR